MALREDLEAELHAAWNPQTLSIYADHLQSVGDPRGELIALDLGPPEGERYSVYWERRQALLDTWLGESLPMRWDHDEDMYVVDGSRTFVGFEAGLCDLVVFGDAATDRAAVERFFASPAAPYLRSMRMAAGGATLSSAIELLASSSRAWLRHVRIQRTDHSDGDHVVIGDTAGFAAATPHLERLDVNGCFMLERLAHPSLVELRVTGSIALDLRNSGPWPRLRELDLAFGDDSPSENYLRGELPVPAHVPALEALRCSREEPGHAFLFPMLGDLPLLAPNLHLPSLRSAEDVRHVQRALDNLPLRGVTIARAFSDHGAWGNELVHPTARIQLPDRLLPWPAPEAHEEVTFGHLMHGTPLALLVAHCEARYDQLGPIEKRAWDHVWEAVRSAAAGRDVELSTHELATALSAGAPTDEADLASLRRVMRAWDRDPEEGSTVAVER